MLIMRKYAEGGNMDIPEEAKDVIAQRQEDKARAKYMEEEKKRNQAPLQAIKDVYGNLRSAIGLDKKEPVKKAKGGKVGSASKRGDGIAQRGKTRGRMV